MRARVRVHPGGVRRMLGSADIAAEMRRRAELVRLAAVLIAPVDTGNYLSRFLRTDAVHTGRHPGTGAAWARVDNDARRPQVPGGAPYGFFLEVGTQHMRAQRILRRALPAAGRR